MFNNKLKLQLTQLQSTISTQQSTIERLTTELTLNKQNLADKESQIVELQSQLSKYSTEALTELNHQLKTKKGNV